MTDCHYDAAKERAETLQFMIKLGFRSDYVQYHYVHEECYEDWTYYHIVDYVGNMWFSQALKYALERRGPFTFKQLMIAAGLTETTAAHLDEVTRDLQTHDSRYTYDQLFDMCLKYLLGDYDELLPGKSYIIQELQMDTWVYDAVEKTRYLPKHAMLNCSDVHAIRRLGMGIGTSDENMIVFHATNWRGYASMKDNGIDINYLRECLDFGYFPSFYVALDVDTAIGWIEKQRRFWKHETCIMVFVLPKAVITGIRGFRSKAFKDASDEWSRLTTHSRRCIKRNSLDDYDFIYGPMVANAQRVRFHNEIAVPHRIVKYQLAVKRQDANAFTYLQQRLFGCIVFKK